METANLKVELFPKQRAFVESKAKEILLSGAFRAGKTRALCQKVLDHALLPKNFVGLCRKERASLRPTTLKTLIEEILEPLGKQLGAKVFQHHKSESRISILGGGEIYYFGFDEELRLGSLGLGAVGVDEAIEINENEYMMLLGRLSNPADPNPQIFSACNPSAPSHFLYKRFFENNPPGNGRELIITKSEDNFVAWAKYKETAASLTGRHYDRWILGHWIAFEGLVYDSWERGVYVKEREGPFPWTICGVDDGYTNPFAVGVWGLDGDGRMHLRKEVYQTHLLPATKVQILKEMGADLYVVDPSAASLIADMQAAGLNAEPGDNAIQDGVRCVQDLFWTRGDGIPRFTVSAECEAFIREVESYTWAKDKDKPEPVMNHHMDEWRYVTKWLHDNWSPTEPEMMVYPGAAMPR